MARKYNGGLEVGTGFDLQSNRPLDERDIVQTQIDLLVLKNCYGGIEVKVEDESYAVYKWNGIDQSNIANWGIQGSGGGTGSGDMLKADYAHDANTVKDSNKLNNQEASAYMTKAVYDPDGNDIVQNSEKLGGQNPAYYDQGQALTDHVDNTDVHLSTDERAAIDGTPTPPTAGNTFATQADIAASGGGDMLEANYGGTDGNTVRNSDAISGLSSTDVDQRPHVADMNNPHGTTKAQLNLGNVDNTSDLAKPISTDTQTALDTKLYGITAGTGISVNGTDPLSPTISTTPQTTAGVISRQYFTGDQETTTSGTFYTTSDTKGAVAETIQSVVCTNGQTQWYAVDYLGGVNPFDTQLYAGTYAGQISVRADKDKDFNKWTVEVYLCNDQGAPTPSGVTGAPVGDLGVQVLAILDSGQLEFKKDEVTQVGFSGPLLENVQLTTGQRARYHISATNTGTSGDTVIYEVLGGFDHMTFIDTPITLSASDIFNDSSVNGSTVKTALEGLESKDNSQDIIIDGKAGLADANTFTGINQFDDLVGMLDGQYVKGASKFYDVGDTYRGEILSDANGILFQTFNGIRIDVGSGFLESNQTIQGIIDDATGRALTTKDYVASSHTINEPVGASGGINIVTLTQAEYDAGTPNANTFYVING